MNDYTDTNLIKPIKKYAFVFVCQKGRIEIECLFLVASLKRFLKCNYELIAVIPTPESIMGKPSEATLGFLRKMGVRIETVENTLIKKAISRDPKIDLNDNKALFIANKLFALRVPTDADKIIFVDSDMIFNEEFHGDISFSIPLNLRLAGIGLYLPSDGKWGKLFEAVGAKMPAERTKMLKQKAHHPDNFYVPPFFNICFFGIHKELVEKFIKEWLRCYEKVYFKRLIPNYQNTGEIPFGLAVHKTGIPYNILTREYKKQLFFHYFSNVENFKKNVEMTELAKSFVEEYPGIESIIGDNKDWQFISDKK